MQFPCRGEGARALIKAKSPGLKCAWQVGRLAVATSAMPIPIIAIPIPIDIAGHAYADAYGVMIITAITTTTTDLDSSISEFGGGPGSSKRDGVPRGTSRT